MSAPHLASGGGVSSAYVVPQARSNSQPTKLAGNFLLIVLRGARGDHAFASVFVKRIEEFEDGMNKGDLLLTIDLASSFRFVTSYNSAISIKTDQITSTQPLGIHAISEQDFNAVIAEVRRSIVVKLQLPPPAMLSVVSESGIAKASELGISTLIGAFTNHFSLEEIWSSGAKPKLPPFGNFSYRKFEKIHGSSIANEALPFFQSLDPTVFTLAEKPQVEHKSDRQAKPPVIDLILQPIDPSQVYARKFVAGTQTEIDLVESLEKTENAEKRHQDMLRDITVKLSSLGYSPLQSSSIDLFLNLAKSTITFELKTAHSSNIISQSAKGVFQLGCYQIALKEVDYANNSLILILEETGDQLLNDYVSQVLNCFDITLLFYDASKPWPQRIEGLIRLLTV